MPATTEPGLKAALRRKPGVGAFWFALGAPVLVEIALTAKPDCVIIDLQHGLWTRVSVEAVLGLDFGGVPTIARLADDTHTAIGAALDAGVEGVLIPLVESAAQAAACVAAAHYPPHGHRSGGGIRPVIQGFPGHVAGARARTAVGIMIETAAGVEAVEAIAATPGLDFVFIGTNDLAISLGCFPQADAGHEAACQRILRACQAVGVPCGIFTGNATDAARRLGEGYALSVAASDLGLAMAGFPAAKAALTSATAAV
ncbi:HpcH/HpaI aldolase family protein [Lichenifustis flavocetrariae]|uniref:Aldolase/citrate lyase family protein n=1 Tax=Lichenifustis flavocetrariae TaxID=2949735 RepID=A0AA41YZ80_9HYPH|nr:aldolase/citrate lyase family protein [Lichenifustis flavocetrariae]MCW6510016.1 aldolase/citrate lyase family protein [Lichenifustis flavocetrariae]